MKLWPVIFSTLHLTSNSFALKLHNFDIYNLVRSCTREEYVDHTFCDNVTVPHDLPSGDHLPFTDNNIFFIETACKGGLDYREACSVEAAARAHKRRRVNVLFTGPVPKKCALTGPIYALHKVPNVKMYRIHLKEFSKRTPLHAWFKSGYWDVIMQKSAFPVRHTADVLRFLTLYKFGGIYLDLDMLVTWSLSLLPKKKNWVGRQDAQNIGSAAISVGNDKIGKMFANETMNILKETFTPNTWSYNSIGVITKALQRICATRDLNKMSTRACQGFTIYPSDYFYPISSGDWPDFFEPLTWDVNGTFMFHLWNKKSHKEEIWEDSLYAQIAAHVCPISFQFFKIKKIPKAG